MANVAANTDPHAVDADNDPTHGSSSGCLALWYAVLQNYAEEARREIIEQPLRFRGVLFTGALEDLSGDQCQLRWICSHLPVDPDWFAWRLLDHITTPAIERKSQ